MPKFTSLEICSGAGGQALGMDDAADLDALFTDLNADT